MRVFKCTYKYMCTYTYTYACIYIYIFLYIHIYGYVYICMYTGGARDVMIPVVGNRHSDTSSNPGKRCLYFT